MIPQEKIEQAAGLYRDELLKEMRRTTGQFIGMPLTHKQIESQVEGYSVGMEAGVRFAEEEMKQIMNEYGQWLADMWSDDHAQCHYNPELYTKFDEERGRNDL